MTKQDDMRSDRLNDNVALFAGCTLNETMAVVFISLVIGLVVGMPPMLLFFSHFTLGLAVSLVVMAIVFLPLLMKLSRLKRGKPAGYYQQYLKINMSKTGLLKNPYVMCTGQWSTERKIK